MIMNKVGSAVFDNLPLIFAVGVAIGMAKKEKEVAALSALIAFFVMNVAINAMLHYRTESQQTARSQQCTGRNHHFCMRYPVLCRWVCLAVLS